MRITKAGHLRIGQRVDLDGTLYFVECVQAGLSERAPVDVWLTPALIGSSEARNHVTADFDYPMSTPGGFRG